ncbi:tRNA pseudouridine(38-40) synthase TruA [Caedibacter taeniospiralis]|uniref:tRNA pseudouridine(38-40) synthase TruA n=1 Tax=Caedibacter taeniospiralis TaxID=28907 RepID=UPI000C274DDF|nr:tRNA pseudouridine(38-40) synthase TruA [Caedibacter taeniospiralis]
MFKHYALVLEYLGTNYCGWQRQNHSTTVQENLEKALSIIANEPITVVCAGRTDTGVHATAQVVHFATKALRDTKAWVFGVNAHLPKDIKVSAVFKVTANFSARFTALYRRYQYVIYQNKTSSAIWHDRTVWINQALDIDNMNVASRDLLGEQDFSAFRSSQCQSFSAMRNVHHAYFKQYGKFIIFDIQGNAFLHHMVRNIVGSLLEIGLHKKPVNWMCELVKARDRAQAGITVPAHGLYLVEVGYPDGFNIKAFQAVPFIDTNLCNTAF